MNTTLYSILITLLALLTACSSSTPAKPTPSSPLECEVQKYPCSYAKVPLAVVQKSLSLSDEAAKQLGAGTPIQQVMSFLKAQPGMAEVLSDGSALRFRLEGGRPMAIDLGIDSRMVPSPPAAKPPVLQSVRPQAVVGVYGQKRALVLSPFRYEFTGKVGEKVAAILETVPGYKGNVTYIYTDDEHDPQVTVDVLTKMADYDVIHLDTHGGSLCISKNQSMSAISNPNSKNQSLSAQSGSNCDGGITDILIQRFHGTTEDLQSLNHPGVIHYRGKQWQSIAVTADFFRHYYPGGLDNAVFILASCNTFRPDFEQAIAGNSSVFLSWDKTVSETRALDASVKLMQALGKGLTTQALSSLLQGQGQEGDPTADAKLLSSYRKAGGRPAHPRVAWCQR